MEFANAVRVILVASSLMLGVSACAGDLSYSNKWRVECSGNAESGGRIELRVTPRGEPATTVTVDVERGRSENGVARDIRDALAEQLPSDTYDVETDDGEDVLLKKNLGESNFALELVSSTVKDVRIVLDRE